MPFQRNSRYRTDKSRNTNYSYNSQQKGSSYKNNYYQKNWKPFCLRNSFQNKNAAKRVHPVWPHKSYTRQEFLKWSHNKYWSTKKGIHFWRQSVSENEISQEQFQGKKMINGKNLTFLQVHRKYGYRLNLTKRKWNEQHLLNDEDYENIDDDMDNDLAQYANNMLTIDQRQDTFQTDEHV